MSTRHARDWVISVCFFFHPDHHEGGQREPGTTCDWTFDSEDANEGTGDLHTPDYQLKNATTCHYHFQGQNNEKITFKIAVYSLK